MARSKENSVVLAAVAVTAIAVALIAGWLISRSKATERVKEDSKVVYAPMGRMETERARLKAVRDVPDFRFDGINDHPVALSDLKGSVWVAQFVYTRCAEGTCPDLIQAMKVIHDRMKDVEGVKFVSFTVDPERDTIPQLKEYAKQYGADTERWEFLRGPEKEVEAVAAGFLLGNTNDVLQHSVKMALVDADGKIQGYYDGYGGLRVAHGKQLEEDIRTLLARGQ